MRKLFTYRLVTGLLLLLIGAGQPARAQAPTWTWVKNPPVQNGSVFNTVMAADPAGNVYVAGSFTGSMTFGLTTLTSPTTGTTPSDVFVVKFTSGGTPIWALRAGSGTGANDKRCTALAVNPAGGVVITGSFSTPTATFGNTVLTNRGTGASAGTTDTFIAKVTPAGTWHWAVGGGGTGQDKGTAVSINSNGEVTVAGDFGSPTGTFGTTVLPNGTGSANSFVAKLNALGGWLWVKGGTVSAGSDVHTRSVVTDGTGNTYVGGAFRGTVAFGTTSLTSASASNPALFVARLSSAGVWQRVVTTGGPGTSSATTLAIDAAGGVYATGYFGGSASTPTVFGTHSLLPVGGGLYNAFVARLDPAGIWQWATPAGGSGFDYGTRLAVDPGGTVLVKGIFQSPTMTFGATTLTNSHGAASVADIFVAYLLPNGIWRQAIGFAGNTTNDGGLTVSANHLVTVTGSFDGPTAPLGPAVLSNLGANGQGLYIAQLDVGPLRVEEDQVDPALAFWPNPAREILHVSAAPGATARLLDGLGRMVLMTALPAGTSTLDVRDLAAGIYLLTLTDATGRRSTRRVVRE